MKGNLHLSLLPTQFDLVEGASEIVEKVETHRRKVAEAQAALNSAKS